MSALDPVASLVLTRILWTSLQAAALVGIVALLIRLAPRIPVSVRCTLWWLVSLQVVVGLCSPSPINLPLLAPAPSIAPVQRVSVPADGTVHDTTMSTAFVATSATTTTYRVATSHPPAGFVDHWQLYLLGLWLLGMTAQLPGFVLQCKRLRGLSRDAKPADALLQAACAQQARRMGLRHCPRVQVSSAVTSPLVAGLLRPVILWPAQDALTADESATALTHELAHIKRSDLWLAGVPALAQRLFFFHPLVRYAVCEYALYREAACDAAALQHGSTPHDYGSLLLRMGVQQMSCAGLGGASSTSRNLKQRLVMLEQRTNKTARLAGWGLTIVVLAATLPYRLVTAGTHAAAVTNAPAPAQADVPPAPPIPPAPPVPQVSVVPSAPAVPSSPRVPSVPPVPTVPGTGFHASNVDLDIDSSAQRGIILFGADSVLVKGNQADRATAKRLYKTNHGPTLWVRRGDNAWVTRGPATIKQAEAIYAKVTTVRRDAANLEGRKWRVKGPLEGLRDRQQNVEERIRELRADPDAPAASARLASLQQQKARIDTRTTELQHQLAALQPQLDAMASREQQANDYADRQIEQLMNEAVAYGTAQATTP